MQSNSSSFNFEYLRNKKSEVRSNSKKRPKKLKKRKLSKPQLELKKFRKNQRKFTKGKDIDF